MDWLIEVAQEYKLVSDTLYLAVSYLDRYLSSAPVERNKLQLVGVTCMLLAAKYEEIYAPQIEEFCYITDNTYNRGQVIAMEHLILAALDFELTVPTAKTFLRRFTKAADAEGTPDPRLEHLASYICELSLPEYSLLHHLPSKVAASAVLLAQLTLKRPGWTATLWHYTGYSARDLQDCARALHHLVLHARKSPLPAIREKYSHTRYHCVSTLPTIDVLPEHMFQSVLY